MKKTAVALVGLALWSAPIAHADGDCDGLYQSNGAGTQVNAHLHLIADHPDPSMPSTHLSADNGCRIDTYPNGSQLTRTDNPDTTSGSVNGEVAAGASPACEGSRLHFIVTDEGDGLIAVGFADLDHPERGWTFRGCPKS
jgi:hypothetical protein